MKRLFFFSIVALFAFSLLVSAQSDLQEIGNGDANTEGASPGAGVFNALAKVFSVADNPSEFTFTRTLSVPFNTQSNTGSITETASFKISGRLKEIDTSSSDNRVFEFQNGSIEWNFQQSSDDGGTRCRRQKVVSGTGKDAISNLDIPFDTNGGKDASGNYVHLNNYGLKLVYKKQGLSGKSEFSIVGQVLIPMDYAQIATPSGSATCDGDSSPSSFTQKKPIVTQFPVTLLNFDAGKFSQSGQLVGVEPSGNNFEGTVVSSSHEAKFSSFVSVTPISLGGDQSPWNVAWKIELPNPGKKIKETLELDSDNDGLTDIDEGIYGTDKHNADTDGDGLLDGWEVKGVYVGGVNAVDLPSMGSDPLKKDVFLEIDWMQNATVSYKPQNAVLQKVINAFADHGIRLHIDIGQWGGGNSVALQPLAAWDSFDFINNSYKPIYLDNNRYLFDIKKDNFNSKRIGIFYYGIFVREMPEATGEATTGGNFFVAMIPRDTVQAKAGTLMHEFGHALQLGHGGRLDHELEYDSVNFKPNYRSVMNYNFQFNGVPVLNFSTGALVYGLDYSEEALTNLDERNGLNEPNGLVSKDPLAVSFYSCRDNGHGQTASDRLDIKNNASKNMIVWFVLNGSGIDWDCNGAISGQPKISVNGNDGSPYDNSGSLELMNGRSDWDKIVLKTGCGGYGIEKSVTQDNQIDVSELHDKCPELADIHSKLGSRNNPETLPPRYPFIGEACDGVDNDGNGKIDEGCPDRDGDGVVDELDNCPGVANADQSDSNGDFVGDACADAYFFNKNTTIGTNAGESSNSATQSEIEQIQNSNGEPNQSAPLGRELAVLTSLTGIDFGSILLAFAAIVIAGIIIAFFVLKKLLRK